MAHLTNFSFEFFYQLFTEDAPLSRLYHGAKKSKMTKNSNQGGVLLQQGKLDRAWLSDIYSSYVRHAVITCNSIKGSYRYLDQARQSRVSLFLDRKKMLAFSPWRNHDLISRLYKTIKEVLWFSLSFLLTLFDLLSGLIQLLFCLFFRPAWQHISHTARPRE